MISNFRISTGAVDQIISLDLHQNDREKEISKILCEKFNLTTKEEVNDFIIQHPNKVATALTENKKHRVIVVPLSENEKSQLNKEKKEKSTENKNMFPSIKKGFLNQTTNTTK